MEATPILITYELATLVPMKVVMNDAPKGYKYVMKQVGYEAIKPQDPNA